MSRIAMTGLVVLLGGVPASAEPLTAELAIARYSELVETRPNCRRERAANEIVVCGRRDADKYRVPLIEYEAGDPRAEGFWAERERIQHRTTPCQDNGPFLVGCGSVGVSVSTKLDGSGPKFRMLAD